MLSLLLFAMHAQAAQLDVEITNIKNPKGHVLVSVFSEAHKAQFPDDSSKATDALKLTVAQAAHFVVTDLPEGDYAIAVLHDENDDGKMNKFMGLPKEGFGFSNNAMGTFGPPSFEKASVHVSAHGAKTQLKMKYF